MTHILTKCEGDSQYFHEAVEKQTAENKAITPRKILVHVLLLVLVLLK